MLKLPKPTIATEKRLRTYLIFFVLAWLNNYKVGARVQRCISASDEDMAVRVKACKKIYS